MFELLKPGIVSLTLACLNKSSKIILLLDFFFFFLSKAVSFKNCVDQTKSFRNSKGINTQNQPNTKVVFLFLIEDELSYNWAQKH